MKFPRNSVQKHEWVRVVFYFYCSTLYICFHKYEFEGVVFYMVMYLNASSYLMFRTLVNKVAVKKASPATEIFLEHKTKKKWVDKDGCCGFILYPRSLFVTWGHREYWSWNCFKETSDDNIEVAKLVSVCWLDVRGKLAMSELTPGVTYESVYEVKLTKSASGWELPISLRLNIPGQQPKVRQVSLLGKPKGEWFELNVGTFKARPNEEGEVGFDLFEHGGHWKSGLIIKAVTIRPKHHTN